MIAYSELALDPGQTIQAKIKGTFPNLLLQILPPDALDLPESMTFSHVQNSEWWVMARINQILNSMGSTDPKIAESLFTFFNAPAPWAEWLNQIEQSISQSDPESLDPAMLEKMVHLKTQSEWPVHLINALSFFQTQDQPLPDHYAFFSLALRLMKAFRHTPIDSEQQAELQKLWDTGWKFFTGLNLYNNYPDSFHRYVPFVIQFEQRWYQGSFVFNKKKDGHSAGYFSVVLDLSRSGPVEALFYFIDREQFNLKIKTKSVELLDRIRISQDELKTQIREIGIRLNQVTLELEKPQWIPGMPLETRESRIDYQV